MLTIRFSRVGKKNRSQFKVALQEHTIAPGGRHVEILGSYDPHQKKAVLKSERIKYWIGQGVNISDSVYNLFAAQGIVEGAKRKIKMPTKKAEAAPAEASTEAKTEEPKAEESKPSEEVKTEAAPAEEKAEEKKEEAPAA